MSQVDLFGREVLEPIKGRQLPLWHEPLPDSRPEAERVGSRNATDPKHTKPLFSQPSLSGQKVG